MIQPCFPVQTLEPFQYCGREPWKCLFVVSPKDEILPSSYSFLVACLHFWCGCIVIDSKNPSDSQNMASSMTAKIFDFISRYFLPANFLDSTRPLSADCNRMLNFKSFHRSFSGPGLVPRGANSTEEQCYQPSRAVEPYDKV